MAEAHTGDGTRWRELLDLNRGVRLPDGTALTSSTQTIPVGTTLTLPAGAHSPAAEPAVKTRADQPHQMHVNSYTVKPGDTLWDIAEEKLGDPTRYLELFDASRDTIQPGGKRLVDPDHIEPGWDITIPAQNTQTSRPDTTHEHGETQQTRGDRAAKESTKKEDQNKQHAGKLDDRTQAGREEQPPRPRQPEAHPSRGLAAEPKRRPERAGHRPGRLSRGGDAERRDAVAAGRPHRCRSAPRRSTFDRSAGAPPQAVPGPPTGSRDQ